MRKNRVWSNIYDKVAKELKVTPEVVQAANENKWKFLKKTIEDKTTGKPFLDNGLGTFIIPRKRLYSKISTLIKLYKKEVITRDDMVTKIKNLWAIRSWYIAQELKNKKWTKMN